MPAPGLAPGRDRGVDLEQARRIGSRGEAAAATATQRRASEREEPSAARFTAWAALESRAMKDCTRSMYLELG